jgi:hypothetical protein
MAEQRDRGTGGRLSFLAALARRVLEDSAPAPPLAPRVITCPAPRPAGHFWGLWWFWTPREHRKTCEQLALSGPVAEGR